MVAETRRPVQKLYTGAADAVLRVMKDAGKGGRETTPSRVLAVSNATGEGALIAAAALHAPDSLVLARGTKLLSSSDWIGRGYQVAFETPEDLKTLLGEEQIDYLIIDPPAGETSVAHWRVLHGWLEAGSVVYHPTAIEVTIDALRRRVGSSRLVAVLEPRSNTMKLGTHRDAMAKSLERADRVWLYQGPNVTWDVAGSVAGLGERAAVARDLEQLVATLGSTLSSGDHVLIMSNGGFGGIHKKLLERLASR